MTDHSRFKLVDNPDLSPGACWLTHSVQGPMIDTGVDVLFAQRGRIYLSVDVIREMAGNAGLLDEEKSYNTEVIEAQAYQRGFAAGIKENVDGNLARLVDQLGIAAAAVGVIRSDDVDPAEVAEAGTGTDVGAPDTPESKPEGSEPPAGQGRGNSRNKRSTGVPAAASNESFRI